MRSCLRRQGNVLNMKATTMVTTSGPVRPSGATAAPRRSPRRQGSRAKGSARTTPVARAVTTTTFKEVVGVVEGAQEPVFYTEEDLKQERLPYKLGGRPTEREILQQRNDAVVGADPDRKRSSRSGGGSGSRCFRTRRQLGE